MTGETSGQSAAPTTASNYDRLWREVYGDIQALGPTHRHERRILRRLLADLHYDSVLDVACGFGHNLPLLTEGRSLRRVGGLDFSDTALDRVRQRWGADFHKLDIERANLGRTYDLVFSSLLLEHVADDRAALENMRAMTGRYLVVVTIAGDFERYRPWELQMGHVRNYRRGELEARLAQSGFQVLRTIYWGFPFYSPLQRMLQNRMRATSRFPPATRVVARVGYWLSFLNSQHRGDLLIALARV